MRICINKRFLKRCVHNKNKSFVKMLRLTALLYLVQYSWSFGMLGRETVFSSLRKNWRTSNVSESVITNFIEQPLDHFNETDKRTWKMRFFEKNDYFKSGGPVYIYIGGEAESFPTEITSGLITDLAEETYGALFATEHRYYGKSIPLPREIRSNLKYLSSRQALADLATLVKKLKSQPEFADSKVVVVGGSYAGNLAAWFRLLYPTLVDAAVASSAPVLAKVDFYEYIETVGDDYRKYGSPGCYEAITKLIKTYIESFKTAEGIEKLKVKFNICNETDFSIIENRLTFYQYILEDFQVYSQYLGGKYIKAHCDKIMNSSVHISEQVIRSNKIHSDFDGCHNFKFPESFPTDTSMWLYQTCTEFAYYQTTSSDAQPFSDISPITYFYKWCSITYNVSEDEIKAAVKRTNEMYEGLSPNVTRVVFTNGGTDPWHRLGVLEDLNSEAPARVTPDATHCQDIMENSPDDSQELLETRKFTKNTIKKWIGFTES